MKVSGVFVLSPRIAGGLAAGLAFFTAPFLTILTVLRRRGRESMMWKRKNAVGRMTVMRSQEGYYVTGNHRKRTS